MNPRISDNMENKILQLEKEIQLDMQLLTSLEEGKLKEHLKEELENLKFEISRLQHTPQS